MGFLNGDINEGVIRCRETAGAVLLDVRTAEEYAGGHIPGSVNVPLQAILKVQDVIPDKNTPVFTYCASGMRSLQASGYMKKKLGYTAVENIGGIQDYTGEIEK